MSFVPFARPDITEEEVQAAADAIRSGWLTTGRIAAGFESDFAEFIGNESIAIATNSATAGLHLAIEALGVGPGDEVLVPTWTFTASAEVIRYVGADPVFVDSDPETLHMDWNAAERLVTSRTKAVIPVDLAGLPLDEGRLADFAGRHGLRVIRDAAHAIPTRWRGQLAGQSRVADATVFSFYATKTITTGEGGMVVTHDEDVASRIRTMRLHGINRDVFDRYTSNKPSWFYEVVAPGFKYNLTDPAAAIGRVQLRRAQEMADRRAAIAARYDEALADLPLQLPTHARPEDSHSWHLYMPRLQASSPLGRDDLISRMAELGVGCSVHFIPLHKQPYWRDTCGLSAADFPVAEAEFARVLSLPVFSSMTDDDVDKTIAALRQALS
ncbi:DegT/DnrJ/EryC1/StrS family aminotransferase [Mariniluteicoccus flavus]